jgi:hypothetical protein
MRIPLEGGTPARVHPDASDRAAAIALDATHVYWTNDSPPESVMRAPK